MLQAGELRGLYAIVPTPSKPGSDRLDALDTVDLEATTAMVEALLADGSAGLIALGTTGECATLSEADYLSFVTHFLEVVDGRVPTFVGASALGGQQVAERLRTLARLGADGTLLGLPMWQPVSTEMAVAYYREAAAAFPDLAIMVYANKRAFRYTFPLEFWAALAREVAGVVAAKYSRPPDLEELLDRVEGEIQIVPNEMTVADFYATSPGTTTACWATAASMGPAAPVALMDALAAGEAGTVAAIAEELAWANEPVRPLLRDPEIFASYNIQIEKARIDAAGYVKAGPCRSPYGHMPAEYAEQAVECGRRWADLHRKYAGRRAAAG
jgi:dihydrodipicolinate synthase/N-acetylneuraminate lyase